MRSWLLIVALFTLARGQTIPVSSRVDCLPKPGANQEWCEYVGCIWDSGQTQQGVPWCYLPRASGYVVSGSIDSKIVTLVKGSGTPGNPYDTDITPIYFTNAIYGSTLNIRIGPLKRYEPLIKIPRGVSTSSDSLTLEKSTATGVFSFVIRRASSGLALWDTSIGGLFFGDKYIQIATYLPSTNIYGFGEHIHQTLKHDMTKYNTWGMLARDEPPNSGANDNDRKNLYGVLPFYLCLEAGGNAHGVLIFNSDPQEVTLGPHPHLVYRTIGGMLDIYYFPGPKPEQVVQQYLQLVGTPFLPAYFALGYQLSRYNYTSLDHMKQIVKGVQAYGIPLDIPYADIDYMNRYKDFTTGDKWQGFGAYAKELHDAGLHLFLIFDPAIQVNYPTYQRAVDMGARFIEWERDDQVPDTNSLYPLTKGTKVMLGVVWPDAHAAFPDFLDTQNTTSDWWTNEFKLYHDQVPFDGIWIDMNEPSSFCTNQDNNACWYIYEGSDHPSDTPLQCPLSGTDSTYDMPTYETANVYYFNNGLGLSEKTLCMLGMTARRTQRFFDTKNLYGISESIATQRAIYESTGKRGAIISRSTFPSSGHYCGHWLGDNTARWDDLRTSIIGAQEFNMFGIPYVGSDICGFIGDTTEELCLRWQQMGAFHPFSRNHNTNNAKPQDPAQWPTVAAATKQANLFRYRHLPYLFSLHFEASLNGATVIRAVFFEFPNDINTYELNYQFMWGSGMMIMPVYTEGATTVSGYLPATATWYSIRESDFGTAMGPGYVHISAPKTDLIPVLARGGVIIPRQVPSITTTASRLNPFELLIPLASAASGSLPAAATGFLYWDDGESIITSFSTYNYFYWTFQFAVTATDATLTITMNKKATLSLPTLDVVDVIGYAFFPDLRAVKLNGQAITLDMNKSNYDSSTNWAHLELKGMINLAGAATQTLSWTHLKA